MVITNEHKIGVCKGTEMEEIVQANFNGETQEVGIYLAMARQAQREGVPEMAEVLSQIAIEEANHAAHFAEMNGVIKSSLKENLEMMIEGETMANKEKKAASDKAKECDIEEAQTFFAESSKDEGRHAKMLKGMLERYF
ncbi:MAG: ferritin-like domain-containing protein [Methanobacterium sp.]|jgi:rubrerythrin